MLLRIPDSLLNFNNNLIFYDKIQEILAYLLIVIPNRIIRLFNVSQALFPKRNGKRALIMLLMVTTP